MAIIRKCEQNISSKQQRTTNVRCISKSSDPTKNTTATQDPTKFEFILNQKGMAIFFVVFFLLPSNCIMFECCDLPYAMHRCLSVCLWNAAGNERLLIICRWNKWITILIFIIPNYKFKLQFQFFNQTAVDNRQIIYDSSMAFDGPKSGTNIFQFVIRFRFVE